MSELVKIRDVTARYGISARTLRYYEDMGLLQSARHEDNAYRMYDRAAVERVEQILVLRKLGISIRDIRRIFDAPGSKAVIDALNEKVEDIDEEVALLHELKDIVLDFIRQLESADFNSAGDVRLLYEKVKVIGGKLTAAPYEGNAAHVNRLAELSARLKKMPEVRVVRLRPCKMATSGEPDREFKRVWEFSSWWKNYKRHCHCYAPGDFLFAQDGGLVWWLMVEDDATSEDCGGYEVIDFEGGLYAVHTSIDADAESTTLVVQKVVKWLEGTGFVHDENRGGRTYLGHMINPDEEIERGLGYHQYEVFIPIKLRD